MTTKVTVLGAGYAGTAAIKHLEDEFADTDVELVWISNTNYHLVRHEMHRAISNPDVQDQLTVPVEEIKSSSTHFARGEVATVDATEQEIVLADESVIGFDYALVCLGSRTAFYDIDRLRTHALTLQTLDDALTIRRTIIETSHGTSDANPVQALVGGGGFTGVQCAGEIAALRDARDLPIEITIIDANENIASNYGSNIRTMLREYLLERNIEIATNRRVASADATTLYFEENSPMDYDTLVWTGGITGKDALGSTDLDQEHGRLNTEATFETSNERIFAVGDCALIGQTGDSVVPPTAEAAWEGGRIAGMNLARATRDESPKPWSYTNEGMLVSVGNATIAHEVKWMPITTFGGPAARFFKKAITAKWISAIASWRRAAQAWPDA
jgi:NADH dehydrogenase